ncbi:MAG: NAD-dependent epimerase/dehydratase family protein [Polyangiaceae bacterium]|nr:NAD-dependent epimerase/dehydratase family protein [Polyangiaceae bacterium]
MRLGITGVAGYIGRLFAERVVAAGIAERIVGVDLAPAPFPASRIQCVRRDVRDPGLAADLAGCDAVVHFAFVVETMRDRKLMYDVNLNGTRNVLAACERAGVSTLVVASSVAAYGVQGDRVIDERTPCLGDARSFYAHTKRLVEDELDVFATRNPGVRLVRVRPSVVLGPRCNTWALGAMAELGRVDTRRGMRLPLVHEDDVVEAFFRALVRPVEGPILVAHRRSLAMADIARRLGRKPLVLPDAWVLRLGDAAFSAGLTRMSSDWLSLTVGNRFDFDPSASEAALDWRPAHDPMETLFVVLANAARLRSRGQRFDARTDRLEGTRYDLPASPGDHP